MTDEPGLTIRECKNCTILRYYCVDEFEISRRSPQFRENAASDEDYHNLTPRCLHDYGFDVWVRCTVACDGPVIVKCQHAKFHDCLCVRALMSGTVQKKIIAQAARAGESGSHIAGMYSPVRM